jgi:hypothetical protein
MKNNLSLLLVFMMVASMISCNKDDNSSIGYSFNLEAKYDTIRSCPGGSGLFIIKLNNPQSQTENINLQLKCDEKLNASLTKDFITLDQSVFEIVIKPANDISISDYTITVMGERKGLVDSLTLKVTIFEWENSSELDEIAANKEMQYIDWLNTNHPDIQITGQTDWDIYTTYPQTLIVEHYTLLNDLYEMRLCCHVMIPPDDWSMIRLRERNSSEAFLAARQDSTGGSIYQIPVEDYPLLYGY